MLRGSFENWKMGDVFGCGQRVNGAMVKGMALLDPGHQIGLFTP